MCASGVQRGEDYAGTIPHTDLCSTATNAGADGPNNIMNASMGDATSPTAEDIRFHRECEKMVFDYDEDGNLGIYDTPQQALK